MPPLPRSGFLPPGKPDAAAKAEALLRQRLGDAAWRLFLQTGQLMRPSTLWPGTEYCVRRKDRVRVIRDGQAVSSLCVVSLHGEPEADRLLTILDLIEADERRLWEMGNLGTAPDRPLPAASSSVSRWRKVFDPSEMPPWWYVGSVLCLTFLITGGVSAIHWLLR